ncbi:hypothetical protein [Deinococcus aquatilis]|uniref:hypothetical protein n=1 Tax=Deinococcus aquatilis TaxID=519440 RepID=UPI0012FBB809|nr:hypothetical protein [Deinococcus aquatilis]
MTPLPTVNSAEHHHELKKRFQSWREELDQRLADLASWEEKQQVKRAEQQRRRGPEHDGLEISPNVAN